MASRGYTVGLPVWVEVDDDGNVSFEVDISEMADAPYESDDPTVDDEFAEVDEETRTKDATAIQNFVKNHFAELANYEEV